MAIKVTNRNAKIDRAGKHNDRNFNLDYASYIDKEKMSSNKYFTYNSDYTRKFNEVELNFYKENFSEHVKNQNEKVIAYEQKNRVISMDDYYKRRNSRPQDKILQIGNANEHPDPELLWECALEYQKRFEEIWGEHCKILTMALHVDEGTPHVHVRRVWMSEDENGNMYVNQSKALRDMGYVRPDLNKPEGRFNNASMVQTQIDIELFKTICEERGIDIDRTEPKKGQTHKETIHHNTQEYEELERSERELRSKRQDVENAQSELNAAQKELSETENKIDTTLENLINQCMLNDELNMYAEKLEKTKKQGYIEKLKAINEIIEEIRVSQTATLTTVISDANEMRAYLKNNNIWDDFNEKRKEKIHKDMQHEKNI